MTTDNDKAVQPLIQAALATLQRGDPRGALAMLVEAERKYPESVGVKLNLALVRLLEVVGEAAGRVSPATCSLYPDIAWSKVVGLRNRLIHGYDDVDFDVLWAILRDDLEPLIAELERILNP